jgi:hypothetical protein
VWGSLTTNAAGVRRLRARDDAFDDPREKP